MVAQSTDIELIRYRNINQWKPCIGDVIIKHGWFIRTKWFGVINFIHPDGSLQIIKDGMIKLLVSTSQNTLSGKTENISSTRMKNEKPGSYTIMQQDASSGLPVWYL